MIDTNISHDKFVLIGLLGSLGIKTPLIQILFLGPLLF